MFMLISACFMLISAEHEILKQLIKSKILKVLFSLALKLSDGVFILLNINVIMPTIVGILPYMTRINFIFS